MTLAANAPVELVIFDNDGVLVDSESIAAGALASQLTACGVPTTAEEVGERYTGWTLPQVIASVNERSSRPLPADFEVRHHAALMAAFRVGLRRVPGAEATLDALDAIGVRCCVASNGAHARLRESLEIVGLLDRFEGMTFSAEDVDEGKPAPDLFLHAARSLDADPVGCVVVEDTPTGIAAARGAGMRVIAVRGTCEDQALGDADLIVSSVREIPGAISPLGCLTDTSYVL